MPQTRRLTSPLASRLTAATVGLTLLSLPCWAGARGVPGPEASAPTRSPAAANAFVPAGRVRLITGEVVHLVTRGGGTVVPTIVGHQAYARFGTADDAYVVPRSAAAELPQLDLSLFDTTALASVTRDGRTPVLVTYAPRRDPRRVPGLRLDLRHSRTVGRRTVVPGSYGPDFRGLRAADLRGVVSIRLDAPAVRTAAASSSKTGVPKHTVTVHVAHRNGSAAGYAVVSVMNVANSNTFLGQAEVDADGIATFQVPEGEYSVVVFTFSKLLTDPAFDVTSDTTVELDLGNATVKPQVTLPGYTPVETALSVARIPEKGPVLPFVFDGPHFFMRLQPVSGHVSQGSLESGSSATLAPRGSGDGPFSRVAVTDDETGGIPTDLTYHHHRADFARVVDRYYATGPAGTRPTVVGPSTFPLDLFTFYRLEVPVPGRRVTLLQGHRYYQDSWFPLARPGLVGDLTDLTVLRRFRAGRSYRLDYGRGPVGPGSASPRDLFVGLIRRHDRLEGFMPLLASAGSGASSIQIGFHDGAWTLRHGSHLLAHGRHAISIDTPVSKRSLRYVLTATSHPRSKQWQLSTRVRDVWSFASRHEHRGIPLLLASYAPPATLAGTARPGRTSFPLRFHSLGRHMSRIVEARVELSTDDGHTWHAARMIRTSATTFRVAYRNPAAHGTARFMSMRVAGSDAAGDSVRETAMRVYRLR